MRTSLRELLRWLAACRAADMDLARNGKTYAKGESFDSDGREMKRYAQLVEYFELQHMLNKEPVVVHGESQRRTHLMIRLEVTMRQLDTLRAVDGKVVGGGGVYVRPNYTARIEQLSRTVGALAREAKPFIDELAAVGP